MRAVSEGRRAVWQWPKGVFSANADHTRRLRNVNLVLHASHAFTISSGTQLSARLPASIIESPALRRFAMLIRHATLTSKKGGDRSNQPRQQM